MSEYKINFDNYDELEFFYYNLVSNYNPKDYNITYDTNIYKLMAKDKLVSEYIKKQQENINKKNANQDYIFNYTFDYKYRSRNSADTFFKDEPNLFEWYKTKNPDFKPLSQLQDLQMPEFATLLLTIAMNVMKVLLEKKYPGSLYKDQTTKNEGKKFNERNNKSNTLLNKKLNFSQKKTKNNSNNKNKNKKNNSNNKNKSKKNNGIVFTDIDYFVKLKSILDDINKLNISNSELPNYFSYKAITEIYLKFIAYMSGNYEIKDFNLTSINFTYNDRISSTCDFLIDYIKRIYLYTPFIIYPTFNQQNEFTVLKTMSAPVINFLITYTRFKSHDLYLSSCYHINHDILVHGTNTHLLLYKAIDPNIRFDYNKPNIYLIFNDKLMTYNEANCQNMKNIYTNTLSKFFSKENLEKYNEYIQMFLFVLIHEFPSGIILDLDQLNSSEILKKIDNVDVYFGNVFGIFNDYRYNKQLLDMTNRLLEEKKKRENKLK
jgi:hypothetical protein